MTFLWPVSLVALVAVAAAAAWALLRPARRQIVAPSVTLWQEAAKTLGGGSRTRRKVGTAWVLLLIGSAAAVLAMARPVLRGRAPARHVAIAILPTAELGDQPELDSLRRAAGALLDRLGEADRMQVVLPEILGGASKWMSPSQARELVARVPLLAAREDQLRLPPADEAAQHVYRFAPGPTATGGGPRITTIAIPGDLPAVTVDALGAEPVEGGIQVFVALRNQTSAPQAVTVTLSDAAGKNAHIERTTLAAAARGALVVTCPAWEGVRAELTTAAGPLRGMGASAYLAARKGVRRRVAIVGDDSPLIRRYVGIDESLELVGEAAQADIVIANRLAAPAGKPALVIDSPQPPPAWQRGGSLENIDLGKGSSADDDPVMAHVSLAGVAVRRVTAWVKADEASGGAALASYNDGALIVRNAPQDGAGLRRVYVAFALEPTNTNFGATAAFVVFMANAMRWLGGEGNGSLSYACTSGLDAPHARWTALAGGGPEQSPLPWPGLYRDKTGSLQAVCLLGLRGGREGGDPVAAARAAPLPQAVASQQQRELWPLAAMAAMACWLAGWLMRQRLLGE
ncbi:MAG: BatA domain-containing protein [Planctomycetaceae bacterium]|nr:BatA domain-containing protein [Planctomycetaceae bacterium]